MNCSSYSSSYCGGTATCSTSCSGGTWNYSACLTSSTQTVTGTDTETTSINCSAYSSSYCSGTMQRYRTRSTSRVDTYCGSTLTATGTTTYGSYGSYTYGSTSGCTAVYSCTATTDSCENRSFLYQCGTATRSVTNSCGTCTYGSWNTSSCKRLYVACPDESTNCANIGNYCDGIATRAPTDCDPCVYGSWVTSSCKTTRSCPDNTINCVNMTGYCGPGQAVLRATNTCGACTYGDYDYSACSVLLDESECQMYENATCASLGMGYTSGQAYRYLLNTCGGCNYRPWETSGCSSGGTWQRVDTIEGGYCSFYTLCSSIGVSEGGSCSTIGEYTECATVTYGSFCNLRGYECGT